MTLYKYLNKRIKTIKKTPPKKIKQKHIYDDCIHTYSRLHTHIRWLQKIKKSINGIGRIHKITGVNQSLVFLYFITTLHSERNEHNGKL